MDKTAVLISGQARTFAHCWGNQYWQFYRHLTNPEFYCLVADDAQADDMRLIEQQYPGKVFIKKVQDLVLELPPQADPKFPYKGGYPCSGNPRSMMIQFWMLEQAWKFFLEASIDPEGHFTQYVRARPDIWFQEYTPNPVPILPRTVLSPWWGTYGGMNDRLAIMGDEAAARYFTLFSAIQQLLDAGCPFHPETLMRANLDGLNVTYDLMAEFKFCRMPDATHPQPWGQPEPFIPFELARAALHR